MKLLSQAMVIARRDFRSIVMTPTFLLFLLAPLIMLGFGAIGGMSAGQLAENAGAKERVVALVADSDRAAFIAADARLREIAGGRMGPPMLDVRSLADADSLPRLHADPDVLAILTGGADAPHIAERDSGGFSGRYLASIAESVAREGSVAAAQTEAKSHPVFAAMEATGAGRAARSGLGYGAVFAIFLLTLLLAGQTVGMMAEEKSNKVIEILAAALPLESVFFGKLLGMLGVALLFVLFWAIMIAGGSLLLTSQMPQVTATYAALTPAIGWPLFIILGIVYFLAAFLLLGAVFLGIGAQASTVREIQMLSMPITFLQVGMFALSSAAANAPGSRLATIAQILPWSSPFAMAARGASDGALWPHLAALAWQALWIAITIWLSVRVFRAGVLRSSSGGWWPFGRKSRVKAPLDS